MNAHEIQSSRLSVGKIFQAMFALYEPGWCEQLLSNQEVDSILTISKEFLLAKLQYLDYKSLMWVPYIRLSVTFLTMCWQLICSAVAKGISLWP